jgi:hypothetical protein
MSVIGRFRTLRAAAMRSGISLIFFADDFNIESHSYTPFGLKSWQDFTFSRKLRVKMLF